MGEANACCCAGVPSGAQGQGVRLTQLSSKAG